MKGYIVQAGWGHCFVGSGETIVRWVFDRQANALVAGQRKTAMGWEDLSRIELEDLNESVVEVNAFAITPADTGFEGEVTEVLPDWAEPSATLKLG